MHKVKLNCKNVFAFTRYELKCDGRDSAISTVPGSSVSAIELKDGSDSTDLSKIQAVQFTFATVKFIPTGIKALLPSLKVVWFHTCGLLAVNKQNLKEFGESLTALNLQKNNLISIDADLFEYNPNLNQIWLEDNPIRYIEPAFFTNVNRMGRDDLQLITLKRAGCIDQEAFGFSIRSTNWNNEKCNDKTAKTETQNVIKEALCDEAKH